MPGPNVLWYLAIGFTWLMFKWTFLGVYYMFYAIIISLYWLTGIGFIPLAIKRGRHHHRT